ncbi:MAG: L-serine ammonia-lyase, iron-sulfur-dependent, subunit alpha [Pirellulaceae bacterium]|jgi:L-serine dehydratase
MSNISIFNDVIGPVMRGPSSSHCAAALRIGRICRDLMGGRIERVLIEMDRSGSLPTTHTSQGSDMGLFGGLLGWDADDPRLPDSLQALQQAGIDHQFATIDIGDPHPNTYRITLWNENGPHSLIAISTGGGMIQVLSVDQFAMETDGGSDEVWWITDEPSAGSAPENATLRIYRSGDATLMQIRSADPLPEAELNRWIATAPKPRWSARIGRVLPVPSNPGAPPPFSTSRQIVEAIQRPETTLSELAMEYEQQRSGYDSHRITDMMLDLTGIWKRSLASGLAGTTYEDRILGYQSGGYVEAMKAGRLIPCGLLDHVVANVTALMEVKSSMGVIIAAPTAGACAALPGVVLAAGEQMQKSDEELAKAFLAAGLIGVVIASQWTFAAEVGGCQAEGGAAASMAAGALVQLNGGTANQALAAASMALQSMLGLICDPIANRVEAPCLGKNIMAAANALCCANMAMAGYDPLIPLDEVVDAARRVSEKMPREHRCTSLGGLATSLTSIRIEERLKKRSEVASR